MLETWLVKCLLLFIGLLICQSWRGRETIIDRLLTWQCCTQFEHWAGILHGIPALLWWCLYWAGSSMLCFLSFFFCKTVLSNFRPHFFSFHIGKFVSGKVQNGYLTNTIQKKTSETSCWHEQTSKPDNSTSYASLHRAKPRRYHSLGRTKALLPRDRRHRHDLEPVEWPSHRTVHNSQPQFETPTEQKNIG